MDVSLPEHRIYSILAAFQVAFVMIGTFAIRLATMKADYTIYQPAPAVALWLRDWGYIFLLAPLGGLIWAIRAAHRDEDQSNSVKRVAVAFLFTAVLGLFFWWYWDRSTIMSGPVMGNGW